MNYVVLLFLWRILLSLLLTIINIVLTFSTIIVTDFSGGASPFGLWCRSVGFKV